MFSGSSSLPNGLGLRPAGPSDQPFIEALFATTRPELQLIDGEQEFIDSIVEMQYRAQTMGYGDSYPNAMYFVVEKLGERIGRVTLDFDSERVHVIDIALVPTARGQGYGAGVIGAIQHVAAKVRAPVSLSVATDRPHAKHLYLKMGFRVEERAPMYEKMIWFPNAQAMGT